MDNVLRNIPKESRTKIVQSIQNINKNLYNTALIEKDIIYLFDIWNKYVQPSNQRNINCRGHRMRVISQYKHNATSWKEWKEQENSL